MKIVEEENEEKPRYNYKTFEEMGLKEEIVGGIYSYGFEKPTEIQQGCII